MSSFYYVFVIKKIRLEKVKKEKDKFLLETLKTVVN